jgi:hypothetical protein
LAAHPARLHAADKPDPSQNQPPPAGAILDLDGTAIPGGGNGTTFQQYTVTFVAAIANTAITFAFRDDPNELLFEEASVIDQTAPAGNLLVNGDFSGGTHLSNTNGGTPVGWTYANNYGATAGGQVRSGCGGPQASGYCWYDGANSAYDAISQTIATNIGHIYQISFYLAENNNQSPYNFGDTTFHRLSTTGENVNAIDVLAYALSGLPSPGSVPTLSEGGLFLMALLLATAGLVLVRRSLAA